jgi:hypothetical protein
MGFRLFQAVEESFVRTALLITTQGREIEKMCFESVMVDFIGS